MELVVETKGLEEQYFYFRPLNKGNTYFSNGPFTLESLESTLKDLPKIDKHGLKAWGILLETSPDASYGIDTIVITRGFLGGYYLNAYLAKDKREKLVRLKVVSPVDQVILDENERSMTKLLAEQMGITLTEEELNQLD